MDDRARRDTLRTSDRRPLPDRTSSRDAVIQAAARLVEVKLQDEEVTRTELERLATEAALSSIKLDS
jgi:hypothetical protein